MKPVSWMPCESVGLSEVWSGRIWLGLKGHCSSESRLSGEDKSHGRRTLYLGGLTPWTTGLEDSRWGLIQRRQSTGSANISSVGQPAATDLWPDNLPTSRGLDQIESSRWQRETSERISLFAQRWSDSPASLGLQGKSGEGLLAPPDYLSLLIPPLISSWPESPSTTQQTYPTS